MANEEKAIVALREALDLAKTKSAAINGDIGQKIKDAQDNLGVNGKALKLVGWMMRQPEEKRQDFVRGFEDIREIAEANGLFGDEHAGDLAGDVDLTNGVSNALVEKLKAKKENDEAAAKANSDAIKKGIKPLKDNGEKKQRKPRGLKKQENKLGISGLN